MTVLLLFVACFSLPLAVGFFFVRNQSDWSGYDQHNHDTWWKELK